MNSMKAKINYMESCMGHVNKIMFVALDPCRPGKTDGQAEWGMSTGCYLAQVPVLYVWGFVWET